MSLGITPARFSNLSAYNLFTVLAITYSTCAFHFRSSLIITSRSLYVVTRSTYTLYPTLTGRNAVTEFFIKLMHISLHFWKFFFRFCIYDLFTFCFFCDVHFWCQGSANEKDWNLIIIRFQSFSLAFKCCCIISNRHF